MKIFFNFSREWLALVVMILFVGGIMYLAINGKKNETQQKKDEKDKK